MSRLVSLLRSFGFVFLIVLAPLSVMAQNGADEESTNQAESAITQATEDVVEDPTKADASDPEKDSPFLEPAKEPGIAIKDLQQLLVPLTAAELTGLADVWQRNLQAAIEHGITLNLSLNGASEEEIAKIREDIVVANEQRGLLQSNYSAVLDAWQRKGGTEEEIKPHRNYLSALTAGVVKTTDWGTLFKLAEEWLISMNGGLGWLVKGITLILAIWAMSFGAMFFRRITRKGLDRFPDMSELLKRFILTIVYWATFFVGIMIVLAGFGVSVGPMMAIFGGLSFVLAFAMQDTLGNLAAGLMIMVLKPFDLGDNVDLAGIAGIVDDMNVVSTTIRTFDNQLIIIPNSKIWGDVITNIDAADTRRVDLVFGIGYGDDAEKAKAILMEIATSHDKVLSDPAPLVFVSELADSSVNINCRPWARTPDFWTVYWDVLATAKQRFDAEGISIPFPQRDVHIIHDAPKEITVAPEPSPKPPVVQDHVSDDVGRGEEQSMTSPEN